MIASQGVCKMDNLVNEVERLCQLVKEHNLKELNIKSDDLTITIVAKKNDAVIAPQLKIQTVPTVAPSIIVGMDAKNAEKVKGNAVEAPLVGIFYRASSPDTPAFVEIGDTVTLGQTIGIVEAMKVFNEITSNFSGTVVDIPAKDGALVEAGDPLVIIG